MRLNRFAMRGVSALALAMLLAGCGGAAERFVTAPGLSGFGPTWGGMRPDFPSESLTVQRIRGAPAAAPEVLYAEPGNVWPAAEGERATMAEPDVALRGLGSRPFFPEAPARGRNLDNPPRADGRVINTPDGPAVTTGGTDRVQGTLSPRGSGVAVRDGGTVFITEPGLPTRMVPAPR